MADQGVAQQQQVPKMPANLTPEARAALARWRQRQWEDYAAENNIETTPMQRIRNGVIKAKDGKMYRYTSRGFEAVEADPYAINPKELSKEEAAQYRKMSAEERQRYAFRERALRDRAVKENKPYLMQEGNEEAEAAYKEYAAQRAAARKAALEARRYEEDYFAAPKVDWGSKIRNFTAGFLSDRDCKHLINAVRPLYGQ